MTLEEFKEKLDKHDWYYIMSEDPKTYEMGQFEHNQLLRIASQNEEFKKLLFKYKEEKWKKE